MEVLTAQGDAAWSPLIQNVYGSMTYGWATTQPELQEYGNVRFNECFGPIASNDPPALPKGVVIGSQLSILYLYPDDLSSLP